MVPECSDHRRSVIFCEEGIFLEVFLQLCGENVFFTEKTVNTISACLPKDKVQISMLPQKLPSMKSTQQRDSQLIVLPSAAVSCELYQIRLQSYFVVLDAGHYHILCMYCVI